MFARLATSFQRPINSILYFRLNLEQRTVGRRSSSYACALVRFFSQSHILLISEHENTKELRMPGCKLVTEENVKDLIDSVDTILTDCDGEFTYNCGTIYSYINWNDIPH